MYTLRAPRNTSLGKLVCCSRMLPQDMMLLSSLFMKEYIKCTSHYNVNTCQISYLSESDRQCLCRERNVTKNIGNGIKSIARLQYASLTILPTCMKKGKHYQYNIILDYEFSSTEKNGLIS